MNGCRPQAGHLLTTEGRYAIRGHIKELSVRLDRVTSDRERGILEQQIANLWMEQQNDRDTRPRRRGGNSNGRKR